MSNHKVQGVKELNYPKVAVVVPTYNEAENLPVLAERLFALDVSELTLIVVDDGSPDGTGEVAKQLAAQYDGRVELVQRHRKEGLGPAYIAGFSHALDAGADVIVQMDADLSHQPEYIPQFIDALGESDVVIGSRYVSGGGVDEHWGIMRRLISSGGNWGIRTVTGVKVKDATGGFKAFRAERVAVNRLLADSLRRFRLPGGDQSHVRAYGLCSYRTPDYLHRPHDGEIQDVPRHHDRGDVEAPATSMEVRLMRSKSFG